MTLMKVLVDAPRPLTAEQIRERVPGYSDDKEAFRRTFERDKSELSEILQHPLRAEPVPGADPPIDGYRIRPDDAFLRDPGLTVDERRALAVATSAVRLVGLDPTTATGKVGATGSVAVTAATELPADTNVVALFRAVSERRVATFAYRGDQRRVHPRGLRFARGRWYLEAFDAVRDDDRQFRLDRIEGDVATGPPDAFPEAGPSGTTRLDEPWTFGDGPAVTARVRVDPTRADAARRAAPNAPAETGPDGSVVLAVPVRNLDAFRAFVLGFGPDAEILDPPEARTDMVEWLTAIVERSP